MSPHFKVCLSGILAATDSFVYHAAKGAEKHTLSGIAEAVPW